VVSKDARTLLTLVAALILPAYYHTSSVPYLSKHLVQDLPEELPLTACQPQRHRQIEEKVRQVRSGSTVMVENGTNGLFA